MGPFRAVGARARRCFGKSAVNIIIVGLRAGDNRDHCFARGPGGFGRGGRGKLRGSACRNHFRSCVSRGRTHAQDVNHSGRRKVNEKAVGFRTRLCYMLGFAGTGLPRGRQRFLHERIHQLPSWRDDGKTSLQKTFRQHSDAV